MACSGTVMCLASILCGAHTRRLPKTKGSLSMTRALQGGFLFFGPVSAHLANVPVAAGIKNQLGGGRQGQLRLRCKVPLLYSVIPFILGVNHFNSPLCLERDASDKPAGGWYGFLHWVAFLISGTNRSLLVQYKIPDDLSSKRSRGNLPRLGIFRVLFQVPGFHFSSCL